MPSYAIAHVQKNGQDMIIVPVNDNFGHSPSTEQHAFIRNLQARAISAGLAGTVVPVWSRGFIAPRPWHPFFQSLPCLAVHGMLNRQIRW